MLAEQEYILKSLAIRRYPMEACAFIFEEEVIEVSNVAANTSCAFYVNPAELLQIFQNHKGQKTILWHSHTKAIRGLDIRTPSAEDIALQERTGCELSISGFDGTKYFDPVAFPAKLNPELSLIGRPYIAGIFDCGTLVRDAYFSMFGVTLEYKFKADYLYPKNWGSAITAFLNTNNFYPLDSSDRLHPGDLLIIDRQSLPAAHGVMVWDEDLQILDQREKSCLVSMDSLELIRSAWRLL